MTSKITKLLLGVMACCAALFTSCSDDNDPTLLDVIKVSSSYVAISQDGGQTDITINAQQEWEMTSQRWIEGKDTTFAPTPKWLTVSQTSGAAGQTTLTFSADATLDGRTCQLIIACAGQTQRINVIQGLSTVSNATCAEVIAGPDSKTYRVTGTVTSIANTTYGNWYLNDGTGTIYIYGTLDSNGATKNFSSWGLEVGDEITVEGPKTTYNGTVELVDVTVININRSLIKAEIEDTKLPMEGGEITAEVTCKGNGINVQIPEDAKDWLSISNITASTVTFKAQPNDGGDREATVVFSTTDGKKEYTSQVTIAQSGAIVTATVAEFLAAEVGNTQYRITGVIASVKNASYGNVYIKDFSGEAYVYGIGKKGDFETLGLKEGDIVTIVGKRGEYNGSAQMTGGQYESHIAVSDISIADFLAAPDSKDVYYRVTGTIDEVANNTYGNLYINDGNGNRLYVYGCYPGYGATGDNRKGFLATAGIEVGDQLTIIGYKDTYKETIELCGGIYFSHNKVEPTE